MQIFEAVEHAMINRRENSKASGTGWRTAQRA
jgi:hypothetical protein